MPLFCSTAFIQQISGIQLQNPCDTETWSGDLLRPLHGRSQVSPLHISSGLQILAAQLQLTVAVLYKQQTLELFALHLLEHFRYISLFLLFSWPSFSDSANFTCWADSIFGRNLLTRSLPENWECVVAFASEIPLSFASSWCILMPSLFSLRVKSVSWSFFLPPHPLN